MIKQLLTVQMCSWYVKVLLNGKAVSHSRRMFSLKTALEGCVAPVELSPYCGWVLDSLSGQLAQEITPSGTSTPKQSTPLPKRASAEKIPPGSHRSFSPPSSTEPSETKVAL